MFKNTGIPKELKGSGLKQKLVDYLKENPDINFNLEIKTIHCNSKCIAKLTEYINKLNEEIGH